MGAKNKVIAGDYQGKDIFCMLGEFYIYNADSYNNNVQLDKTTIKQYEIVDEESRKSASSAVGRAAVGAAFLGPIGLLAGVTAKWKGIYTVAIEFYDGKKCLMEIDEKRYKELLKKMF